MYLSTHFLKKTIFLLFSILHMAAHNMAISDDKHNRTDMNLQKSESNSLLGINAHTDYF